MLLLRSKNLETNDRDYRTSSLCNLCVLCAFVVKELFDTTTTEAQSTQRLHRESDFSCKALDATIYPTGFTRT